MPAITRQAPKPAPPLAAPAGSILATSVAVTKLGEEYTKLCIYGRNRSGKTTLGAQFKKPLLIISSEPDANGGAMSVSDMDGV